MTFGSLFAGIGGIDLGLERASMVCKWQVENDPYAQKVLEKHWPKVRRWDDVRTFPPEGDWGVDLICGGFPCQDISNAGKRAGIEGERSGLWSEFARIIRVLRPRYVLVENVAALLGRGLDRILGDLAASGYDAEWNCIPAVAFGANHRRERVFIVAHPACESTQDPILQAAPRDKFFGCEFRGNYLRTISRGFWETSQPPFVDVDDGVSGWAHSARGLGNAVVPQVAEWIGRRILEVHNDPLP